MPLQSLPSLRIEKVEHLATQLGLSVDGLLHFSKRSLEGHYTKVERKPNGKERTLEPPFEDIKKIQRTINRVLLERIQLPDFFHGGRKGHSALTNALPHVGKPTVLKADLKEFFPKITNRMVYRMFVHRCRCSPQVARILTMLTTYKGHVPQGSPTSCYVSALVLEKAAWRMKSLADKQGWGFTVYIDDLTFSGPSHLPKFKNTLRRIAREHGFVPNEKKMITMNSIKEQEVTGWRVNGSKVGVVRSKRDELFRELQALVDNYPESLPPKSTLQSLLGRAAQAAQVNKRMANAVLHHPKIRAWRDEYGI